MMKYVILALLAVWLTTATAPVAEAEPLRILFLGDEGHHQPSARFEQLEPVLANRDIELIYSQQMSLLHPASLADYDGLLIYANITEIAPEQEQALLDFVEEGKGLIGIHCASYCFLNSPKYVALLGGQFERHGTGTFGTVIAEPDHPLMRGFSGFRSWDETYVHTKHNEQNRTVLEYRNDGQRQEPWTWVRTQGKGRVFYTAWGHDHRTWGNPGFVNLVERGIRWACGDDPSVVPPYRERGQFSVPAMAERPAELPPLEYIDVGAKIPNYVPSRQWGTQGEPLSQMQLPLEPEQSMKRLVVPEGFRVELFVAEPDLQAKPLCMNWDERGRLWVAETVDYPNALQPAGQGNDRIRICEDTDLDGRADKFTVFAENLSIPTSIMFHRGGAIVQDGTQTLYLKDTDGDDRADQREVLFTGWSMRDTHGGVSNFQYGLDNWIWAMQGYNGSRVAAGNQVHQFRQGFFRFKPDGSQLEFLRSTNNNTWGLGISEEGIIFGSTANGNPSEYMPIPNRYYERVRGWLPSLVLRGIADSNAFQPITERVRQVDHHGGYTAAAGHALYTARQYPEAYWNRTAFVAEPTGHLVATFVLEPDGSHFKSTNPFNLLASDDEWTAPIMAEVGPDGCVWIIDWYNYIVQHNPTPHGFRTGRGAAYETDLRDKKHGRIYHVIYGEDDEDSADKPMSLENATPEELVRTLSHSNLFWRRHAQRLLVERGQRDVVPALLELVGDQSMDAIGLNVGAIHALWTLHGLGAFDGQDSRANEAVVAALRHPSAAVRRNAVQVLPGQSGSAEAILEAEMLRDPDAQVRLMALLALADLPPASRAGAAIVQVLNDPANAADRWIPEAAICAAAAGSEDFLRSMAEARRPNERSVEAAAVVAQHLARGGSESAIAQLIPVLIEAEPRVIAAIASGLEQGWPADRPLQLSEQLEVDLETLVGRVPPEARSPLVRLGKTWGSTRLEKYIEQLTASLRKQLTDDSLEGRQRAQAAEELLRYHPASSEVAEGLLDAITPRTPADAAVEMLRSLEQSEVPELGQMIIERMRAWTPSVQAAALRVLLSRSAWTNSMLDSAELGQLQLAELALDQQQALRQHPDKDIRRRAEELLRRGGSLPNADREKVVQELLPLTQLQGDPEAGRTVFKAQCAKCHVHSGEGSHVGPDLTGMAVHPKEELLVQIIDPSRSVESNYRVYTIVTTDGVLLSGLLAAESRTALELFDAEGKKHTLLREDVEDLAASPKSLMPDGFEKQVTTKELVDLLEFLTHRGKYLPLPLHKVATTVTTRGMFYDAAARAERLVFGDWSPKTFQGIPFQLVDPQGSRVPNAVMLYSPQGTFPPEMPKAVRLPCNTSAQAIHLLSGVAGWGFPLGQRGSVSMIVRLHYADGETEDHQLQNGIHFADYIRRVDVPESQFAFDLNGRQIRHLSVTPKRQEVIREIELVKGPDATAPVVMAVTVETTTAKEAATGGE